MRKIYFLLVFLFFNFTYSQNCNEKVVEVYENIINSIGNKSKWPPELDIRAENVGGAHRNHKVVCERLKKSILKNLSLIKNLDTETLLRERNGRYLNYLP